MAFGPGIRTRLSCSAMYCLSSALTVRQSSLNSLATSRADDSAVIRFDRNSDHVYPARALQDRLYSHEIFGDGAVNLPDREPHTTAVRAMSRKRLIERAACDPGCGCRRGIFASMKTNERAALIRRIDDDVGRIQQFLDECYSQMSGVEERFRAARGALLREARTQTRRGQHTNLILKVRRRERRVIAIPVAEWRTITSRGNRVARAQQTLGQASMALGESRGRIAVFTTTLTMNRKFGWRIGDLRTRAHPCEIDLVAQTEADLLPIRKRVAALSSTATRLLQRRYQHQRRLEMAPLAEPKDAPRKRNAQSPTSTVNQLFLEPDSTKPEEAFERPQLRNPDQY